LLASERHRPQMRWKPATRALDEFSPLLSESEREHMDSERRPIKASVRNRWWLYVTLMRNPSLRKFRRSGMMVERPGIVGRLWRAVRGSGKTTQTPPPLKQPVDEHSATVQHK
jgi:hypothetical protein